MIGVSPAYFVSLFGSSFAAADVIASLPDISRMGYQSIQLEAYCPETIRIWATSGFHQVASAAARHDLWISQCVGHALLNGFTDEETLFSDWGIEEAKIMVEGISSLPCPVFTLPLPPFSFPKGPRTDGERLARINRRFVEKLTRIVDVVSARSKVFALEVLPGSLVGGLNGFLELAEKIESIVGTKICCNFDTGHAHADNEALPLVISRLGSRIVGTHICDNWGTENLSLRPGSAGIPWKELISAMASIEYAGSYDVEIACAAPDVHAEYSSAISFLSNFFHHKNRINRT